LQNNATNLFVQKNLKNLLQMDVFEPVNVDCLGRMLFGSHLLRQLPYGNGSWAFRNLLFIASLHQFVNSEPDTIFPPENLVRSFFASPF
jgi:hypothetical protein